MPPGVDLASLERWLDAVDIGSGPIENIAPIGGGTQNIMLDFNRGGRHLVLRRPPLHPRENSNATMRREIRLLGALAATSVPHPRLVAACDDETVLGAVFYVSEFVAGFNASAGLPPLQAKSTALRRAMGFAAVDGLVLLGGLDHQALGLADFGKAEAYLERQVARWLSQLSGYSGLAGWPGPELLVGLDGIAGWLQRDMPDHFVPGILHGDYHLANVLFCLDGSALAAIVDWELATIGDPLIDLGWLLATSWTEGPGQAGTLLPIWAGFPSPSELVEHYARSSPRDLSEIRWYVVFACFKLAILLEGTHARACAGQASKATGDRLHTKAVELLRRATLWIDGDQL